MRIEQCALASLWILLLPMTSSFGFFQGLRRQRTNTAVLYAEPPPQRKLSKKQQAELERLEILSQEANKRRAVLESELGEIDKQRAELERRTAQVLAQGGAGVGSTLAVAGLLGLPIAAVVASRQGLIARDKEPQPPKIDPPSGKKIVQKKESAAVTRSSMFGNLLGNSKEKTSSASNVKSKTRASPGAAKSMFAGKTPSKEDVQAMKKKQQASIEKSSKKGNAVCVTFSYIYMRVCVCVCLTYL